MYSLKLNKHYPFWKKDTSKLDEISKSNIFLLKNAFFKTVGHR